MNSLMTAVAVANPVITAVLLLVVLFERGKLQKRSEAFEALLKQSSQAFIESVEAISKELDKVNQNLGNTPHSVSEMLNKIEAAQHGVSSAIQELQETFSKELDKVNQNLGNTPHSVSETLNKIEAAQHGVSSAIQELQETLKSTVSL